MTVVERKREELRAQWAKYDEAVKYGMTGAPLAQIDRKLTRLTRELTALETSCG